MASSGTTLPFSGLSGIVSEMDISLSVNSIAMCGLSHEINSSIS